MNIDARLFQRLMLQLRCRLIRANPFHAAALALLVLGVLGVALWVPHLNTELKQKQIEVDQAKVLASAAPVTLVAAPTLNQQRMQIFIDNLGAAGYAEQQLKTLFDVAAKKGLKLNEGEYKTALDRNADMVLYQVQLPVAGPYPAIREFCEEVLLAVPFASLDEISFKREAISNSNLEAKLRFTLYLREQP